MYVRAHVCVRACASVCARMRVCARVINNTSRQTQEYDELVRKQRDEGAEKIFRKMRWDCRSCELSDDPIQSQNFTKPLSCFGVRNASDFVQRLLPQGKWTRCIQCSHERKGQSGGNANKERCLASSRACETCARCKRLLTRPDFWPEDWKHRSKHPESLACRDCRPAP